MQGFCFAAGVNRRVDRAAQKKLKTSLLSAFNMVPKKKKLQISFLRVGVILFFVHPLLPYRLLKHSHMGI